MSEKVLFNVITEKLGKLLDDVKDLFGNKPKKCLVPVPVRVDEEERRVIEEERRGHIG